MTKEKNIEDITIAPQKLNHILRDAIKNKSQRKIVFVVGSGCSLEAGIPSGEQLAKKWYDELVIDLPKKEFEEWVSENDISDADPGSSYTEIYRKRYENDTKGGFEFLARLMEKAQPSAGHILLARALTKDTGLHHRTIITTNFDHLAEQSVYAYTSRIPFICGHESLAPYADQSMDHPLVVKVHRDVHFAPKNQTKEVAILDGGWVELLDNLFANSMVIVLGYGGNDGSLMNYLRNKKNIGNLIWTLYKDTKPKKDIEELVLANKNGRFLRHEGFSKLMLHIAEGLSLGFGMDELAAESKSKVEKYRKEFEELNSKGTGEEKELIANIAKQDPRYWWTAQWEINAEKDIKKKDAMYLEAIEEFPDNPELINSYIVFIYKQKKYPPDLEKYYKRALELAPDDADFYGNYALFLKDIKKDYTEAEKYYKKALEIDPNHANNNGNYAIFLTAIKKDYTLAEKYYKKALELDANHANANGNYASLLLGLGRKKEALTYYQKAKSAPDIGDDLKLELYFYQYAHLDDKEQAAQKIEELLAQDARSGFWDFSLNIERAIADGHPDPDRLRDLAHRISGLDYSATGVKK